jgi:AAHS family 4-hydroxybenzoate transporter-like MFS transporter
VRKEDLGDSGEYSRHWTNPADKPRRIDVAEFMDTARVSLLQLRVIAICALLAAIAGFDQQSIFVVAPGLTDLWRAKPLVFTAIFNAGFFGMAVGGLLFGPAADTFGRKRTLLGAALALGVTSLSCVFADRPEILLLLRVAVGAAVGGLLTCAVTEMAEFAPHRRAATMVAMVLAGFPIGTVVCNLLGDAVITLWDWTTVFSIGGVVPLVLALVMIYAVPETPRYLTANRKSRRLIVAVLGPIRTDMLMRKRDRYYLPEQTMFNAIIVPMFVDRRLSGTLLSWIGLGAIAMVNYLVLGFLATVMRRAFMPTSDLQFLVTLFNLGGVIGTLALGYFCDHGSPWRVLAIAALVGAAVVAPIGLVGDTALALDIDLILAGGVLMGTQAAFIGILATLYPTAARGTGIGWALGIGRLGYVLGPLVGGFIVSFHFDLDFVLVVSALPALAAAAAFALLGGTTLSRGPTLGIPEEP